VSASKAGTSQRKLLVGQTAPQAWDGGLGMVTWRNAEGAQTLSLDGVALGELGVPGASQEEDDSPGAGWCFYAPLEGPLSQHKLSHQPPGRRGESREAT